MSEFQKVDKNEEKKQTAPEAGTVRRELSDVNGPQGGMLPDSVSQRIQSKRGSGSRLTPEQNKKYSGEFGRDMSDVRIHNDPESNAISQALNARAFTIGADVFLSKGIDPGRSKRDQKTLKHELTHVVQQNGQAGSGALRLGAAHTAQEHEAEASAEGRGGVNTSAGDTVQRGFFKDALSGVGHMLLKQFGLEDAFNDFMSGSDKVDAAEKKMKEDADQTNWTAYEELKKKYDASVKEVDTAEKTYKKEAKKYEKEQNDQIKAEKQAAKSGGHAPARIVNADAVNTAKETYDSKYKEHENLKTERLALLQKYDETITQEDVDKKDSGAGKLVLSVVLSSLAGGASTLFNRDDPAAGGDAKKLAAARLEKQKKARSQVNNWFASTNKGHRSKLKTEERKTVSMDRITNKKDAKETKVPEEQYKDVIWSVYQDIKDEDWLKDVKIEKDALWTKITALPAWTGAGGFKSAFDDMMVSRLSEGTLSAHRDAAQFLSAYNKKMNAEGKLAKAPGFRRAAGMKKEMDAAEAAATEAQNKLNAFDNKANAEGIGTVEVTVAGETRSLNRAFADTAVRDAQAAKDEAERVLAAAAPADQPAAQAELDNKTAAYNKAVEFKDELERLITDWTALIGGASREDLELAANAAGAEKNAKKQTYDNEGRSIYEGAIAANADLVNYVDDAANPESIAHFEAEMAGHRANAHAAINPAEVTRLLGSWHVDQLKELIRNTVISTVTGMKNAQADAERTGNDNRAANFLNDQKLIAEGIYEQTKGRAKNLPLYQGEGGAALEEGVLRTKLLAGIKQTAEMASFWEKVKSASSGTANTAMDRDTVVNFVDEGTKAYTEVLENIRRGDSAEGGAKYPKGAGDALFNSIREKAYALLPQELKTYFVGADEEKFTNLFGGGDLQAYKTNIVEMTGAGVPIEVDKEAAILSDKIRAQEDWNNRAAQEKDENQRAKAEAKERQITEIITSTFEAVQNDNDLKDSYKSSLRFRNMLKKEYMDLMEDGLGQDLPTREIVAAIVEVLKEKQEKMKVEPGQVTVPQQRSSRRGRRLRGRR